MFYLSSALPMVTSAQLTSRKVLGLNQRTYAGLKTALQLNLRRQLLIAVCDDTALQQQLVSQLQADVSPPGTDPVEDARPAQLAILEFDPEHPDLIVQIVQWLKTVGTPTPHLQVVGLEQMTQQPLRSQHHFLRSLENIKSLLPHLDSSLVLWVSWPWYRTLQQSTPEFWQWRSGVFAFVGEPVQVDSAPIAAPVGKELYGETADDGTAERRADVWQILGEDLAQSSRPDPVAQTAAETPTQGDREPVEADPTIPAASSTAVPVAAAPISPEMLAQLQAQGESPAEIAQAYLAVGNHYRDRIEAGDMTKTLLADAITAFEEALKWLPATDIPQGPSFNDLATLYWLRAQVQAEPTQLTADVERSLELYQLGIERTDAVADPDTVSRLHSNLGAVHSALANYGDPIPHLRAAVEAYRQAMPHCSPQATPEDYATVCNSLGAAYWKLGHYEEPQTHIQQAIEAYREALKLHTPAQSPLDYAAVQNNLGIAYWSLSRHQRPIALLNQAIVAYREALKYRTPTSDAAACASTYNNLGTAYWELANHPEAPADPEDGCRRNAIIAYEAALQAAAMGPHSLDLGSIRHCVGSIYDQWAKTATDPAESAMYLERSLDHYLSALGSLNKTATAYDPIFRALVANVATHYELLGLDGQQLALAKIPPALLPEVMRQL